MLETTTTKQPSAASDATPAPGPFGPPQAQQLLEALRETFDSGRTRSLAWRLGQLEALEALVLEREDELCEALRQDLGKSRFEAWLGELGVLRAELRHTRKHLAEWVRPERVPVPFPLQPARAEVVREPLGVVLIIAPWNYPVQLALAPLIGALAAGNCAVVKPSEIAPASSAVLAEWLPRYLDPDAVRVVQGGVPETQALLAQRWDHVFYTGNGRVGRIVMKAAAEHLTPVTLELGGKSPCFVLRDADLRTAARRIAWGKFFNAGQTCVAPDYLLVDRAVEQPLLDALGEAIHRFYGERPRQSPDYARIVNERHFDRLVGLLQGSGQVVFGGEYDRDARYIAPTVLREVPEDAPVMQEEIFGPILPVLTYGELSEAIERVRRGEEPLALYVFGRSPGEVDRVLSETRSGGACVNDVVVHLSVPDLPFGGVGESGMGAYHGRASFETFSHRRSVLRKGTRLDPPLRYPPYDERTLRWVKKLL